MKKQWKPGGYHAYVTDVDGVEWVWDIEGHWTFAHYALPKPLTPEYAVRKCKAEMRRGGIKSYAVEHENRSRWILK